MLGYGRGKIRGGRVGGFPEPEREGSRRPKGVARKVLFAWKVLLARKVLPMRKNLPARARLRRGRELDDNAKTLLCGSCVAGQYPHEVFSIYI